MTNPVFQPPADPPPAPPRQDPAPGPDRSDPSPAAHPGTEDDRKGGDRAILADLAKEREKRHQLEARLSKLSPLEQLAEMFAANGQKPPDGKSEYDALRDKFETYEKDLADERAARWRAEIAAEKGLTAQQASRLRGATRDELAADADELVALFPAPGPRTPAPDPSQGARGGQPGPDLQAQIEAAKKAGDFWKAAALERSKLLDIPRPR